MLSITKQLQVENPLNLVQEFGNSRPLTGDGSGQRCLSLRCLLVCAQIDASLSNALHQFRQKRDRFCGHGHWMMIISQWNGKSFYYFYYFQTFFFLQLKQLPCLSVNFNVLRITCRHCAVVAHMGFFLMVMLTVEAAIKAYASLSCSLVSLAEYVRFSWTHTHKHTHTHPFPSKACSPRQSFPFRNPSS